MAFGLHFTDTWAGRVFSQANTPLGLAIPIYTATTVTGGLPILNPAGSGVNLELINYDIQWASGTAAIAAVGLMVGFCSGIGTATGCSALAATIPQNCNFALQGGSKVMSSNGGVTTVTAGTATAPVNGVAGAGWVRNLASINLENSTTTPLGTGSTSYWFNGTALVPPGMICYIAATLASVALYATGVCWKEIPITR
jgi:hypothetical protein